MAPALLEDKRVAAPWTGGCQPGLRTCTTRENLGKTPLLVSCKVKLQAALVPALSAQGCLPNTGRIRLICPVCRKLIGTHGYIAQDTEQVVWG